MKLLEQVGVLHTMPDPLRFFGGKEHATVDDFLGYISALGSEIFIGK